MKEAIRKWAVKYLLGMDDTLVYDDISGDAGHLAGEVIELIRSLEDMRPKRIQLLNIEPSEIVNGSTYIWDVGNNKLLVSATLDCLIAFHDDSVWPYRDRLLGSLYGPINVNAS